MIIIGAGPAGMTAAIYGRRAKKKVLVLEAASYGGQIMNALNIENYPVPNNRIRYVVCFRFNFRSNNCCPGHRHHNC